MDLIYVPLESQKNGGEGPEGRNTWRFKLRNAKGLGRSLGRWLSR